MIFGSYRDFKLLEQINQELLHDIVEQEVLYYKPSLENSATNIYGESTQKIFYEPVKINCLIERNEMVRQDIGDLPDVGRNTNFLLLRKDLVTLNLVPEMGDVVEWNKDFFEVDLVKEHQLFLGRFKDYQLTEYGKEFGSSLSILLSAHLTRGDRMGIIEMR